MGEGQRGRAALLVAVGRHTRGGEEPRPRVCTRDVSANRGKIDGAQAQRGGSAKNFEFRGLLGCDQLNSE